MMIKLRLEQYYLPTDKINRFWLTDKMDRLKLYLNTRICTDIYMLHSYVVSYH